MSEPGESADPDSVPEGLAAALGAMGCPPERADLMAAQLHRRAGQLAAERGGTREQALVHLVRLMSGGWAAQARGFPPLAPDPTPPPPDSNPADPMSPIQPWPRTGTRPVGDFRIFSLRADRKVSPRTGAEHEFYVIDCRPWVNICALTPQDELVMVEQYRHGSDTVELELPGGILDPGEDDPVAAGIRELREETGHTGVRARRLGSFFPNAAIMSNTCHTVLIEEARPTHPLELDQGEDIAVRCIPVGEVSELVAAGRIRHCVVIAALHQFDLWRRGILKG